MRCCFVLFFGGVCALAAASSLGYDPEYFEDGMHMYNQKYKMPVIPMTYNKGMTGTPFHSTGDLKMGDKLMLQRQKQILMLYKYINQPYYYHKEHDDMVKDYSIENNMRMYTNQTAVKEFLQYYHHGMLPRGEIFSVFYDYHLGQAIALFNVLYGAQDWDTFYKTAVHLHAKCNEGMFLYALSVALVHRPDCYGLAIPPIYEVYPYYFFNSEVIQKAYQYKMQYYGDVTHQAHMEHKGYMVYANYSGWYTNVHPEQSMSYFTEDVGINMYYWQFNIYYPFWMDSEHYGLKNDRRGEQYYYMYQQLLARYYLERLSNDMEEIDFIDWEQPLPVGYTPSLMYPNGMPFPQRPHYAKLSDYFYNYGQKWWFSNKYAWSYTHVNDYEMRIRDAIDLGFVYSKSGAKIDLYTPEGFEILGNLIECNADSPNPRYYGPLQTYARHLLGYSYQPLSKNHVVPSALEHFETSMRDPAFYMLYKKMVWFFQSYKSYLTPYSYTDLYYPGVKIENVEFDRLITYFDYFDSDITNAMYVTPTEYERGFEGFQVYARQQRLNHKPFNYKITVNSVISGDAMVKMYIGPKYDSFGRKIDINENRLNFVQFDEFRYTLTSGKNVIERSSHMNNLYSCDKMTYQKMYQMVEGAMHNNEEFLMNKCDYYYTFPMRYLLPKGKYGGMPYQIYVMITPYHPPKQFHTENRSHDYYPMVGTGAKYMDSYPMGYPFDRPINEFTFFVPNSYFQEVMVYHRHFDDLMHQHPEEVDTEMH